MYEIKPVSTSTFIEDRKIKLPRFQRTQKWDYKANFKLCISIFKNYPIGVTVINEEKGKRGNTRWLLDGRQRRNALIKMSENPEEIYLWAKKFLNIKKGHQPDEVSDLFWEKIEIHLETEESDELEEQSNTEDKSIIKQGEEDYEDLEEDYDDYEDEEEEEEIDSYEVDNLNFYDLDLLLKIILLCHNQTKSGTKFSKPFDFTNYIDDLEYVNYDKPYKVLDGRKLNTFIQGFHDYLRNEYIDSSEFSVGDFEDYIVKRCKVNEKKKKNLQSQIKKNWESIKERIIASQMIKDKLRDTTVGIIDLKNVTSVDAQNIFKLINSEGTDLTSVEILSAKPSWNKRLKYPSAELEENVKHLYDIMKVQTEGKIVRWDFPATLYGRLKNMRYIFRDLSLNNEKDFNRRLTLGFQIMSAIYEKGIKKEKISRVSKNKEIKWEEDLETLVKELNDLGKLISDHSFFKYVNSWKVSLIDLTSDAIGINFIVLMYKEWSKMGKPIGSNQEVRKLQKNSIVLFDRMIYEYVNRQWRGSSDSRLEGNIENFSEKTFHVVPEDKWKEILDEIFTQNSLNGDEINKASIVKPILYHYYFIKKIAGPNDIDVDIEIDHLIPQSQFNSSKTVDKNIQHNLYNLALLPKKENIAKNNKQLDQVTDPWLKDEIQRYAGIPKSKFSIYSKVQNVEKLKNDRSPLFYNAFQEERNNLFIE